MSIEEILKHIDLTNLKPTATIEDMYALCGRAAAFKTASVCIPPCYVKTIKNQCPNLNICTVVGFPNGYMTSNVKTFEAVEAIADGADEIDMVINISNAKWDRFYDVAEEIARVRRVTRGRILKVIIETCYLNDDQKKRMCEIVTEEDVDYIKTSTGFGTAGATLADIELFKKNIGPNVKIKAAGGIRTREDMEAYLAAGCDRIGASNIDCLMVNG